MSVNTGINTSLLQPKTFHVITYLLGNRALAPLPQRLCLIGVLSAAATVAAAVVTPIDDPSQIDANFGAGSYMALMARKSTETAAKLGQGPSMFAVGIAEGATKATETITIGGTATADDNLVIRIAGRFISVGIASGTTAANAGPLLRDAINAKAAILPVTATAAGAVVTATDNCKGTIGNDTIYDVVHIPAGLTCVAAVGAAGTGVVDLQPALDAIAGQQFDAIAVCNHASADVTEIMTQVNATWTASAKKPRWFFIGEPGTVSAATTLAGAANHEGVEIISWQQSRSLPGEIAAANATAALSKNRPNANYDGLQLPLYPPPIAYSYTDAQIETALLAGVTPMVSVVNASSGAVVEGTGAIVRLVTTRTTLNSQPYGLTRDFGTSRTAWAMAKQYDIAYARLQAQQAGGDGMLMDDDTIDLVRDTIIDVDYAAQDAKWIKNVDDNKDLLIVEADATVSGRLDVDSTYAIVVGMHQVAYVHRAQLG